MSLTATIFEITDARSGARVASATTNTVMGIVQRANGRFGLVP